MSIATTAAIVAASAAVASSKNASRKDLHPTKYDGWILLGIVVVEVGLAVLGCYWPW